MVKYESGTCGIDSGNLFQIGQRGSGNGFGCPEGMEQSAFAHGADADDLVERVFGEILFAAGAMRAYSKAMGLIAKTLDKI